MNNIYNVMIYPFDIDSVSLIRHNNLINNYKFVHAVSPNGWGLTGKDVSCADYGEHLGLVVENDFDKALEDCDTVLFVKPNLELDFTNIIYPKMIKACESSKNIICAIKLEEKVKNEISEICVQNNKFFKYLIDENKEVKKPLEERTFKIDTPVIFVIGLSEMANKFETQLSIRENLIKMGYKVSQIGTRNYCELMGFHSFPQFMYEKKFYEWDKITLFNYYIKKMEINEQPDVIVIGIPGSTLPINDIFPNKFGVLAYEVSKAVTPDVTVLSTLYQDKFSDQYFDLISKEHENKFGYGIDCYNISNSIYNKFYSELLKKMQYVILDWKFVSKKIKDNNLVNTSIYNVLDKNDGEKMTEFLVERLAEYAE